MNKWTRLSLMSVLLFAGTGSFLTRAQSGQAGGAAASNQALIERGRYIVEGVAMCERCHTRRDEHGNPDRANWLMGGPVQTEPTYSDPNWATIEPRIAGTPPGTDAEFIRLLTTGISRTGRPPADAAFPDDAPGRRSRPGLSQIAALKRARSAQKGLAERCIE
jgi:hypothetical protein